MHETILRNGEIAFTASGDVIMNVDTLIELRSKLEKGNQVNKKEQTNEEAFENVVNLLVELFGPEILDEKANKTPTPDLTKMRAIPKILRSENPSAARQEEFDPYLYVDNYGNIFATRAEVDFRHILPWGAAAKIVDGKQAMGYAPGYMNSCFKDEAKEVKDYTVDLLNIPDADKKKATVDFSGPHLVSVVRVLKSEIVPRQSNDYESRYLAWRNATLKAAIQLRDKVSSNTVWAKLLNQYSFRNYKGCVHPTIARGDRLKEVYSM